ncbi:uncharacterized protein LOC128860131 [Anastrepha ludens]|uniref:uncharacterized protein LOC128860131 n=1 Tax=Anastrepha ludens TaxID=28586 RepID=UPI0023AF1DC7|nr:uncharacterized protein LOC128860131 [Anastrepha ludens]
MDVLLLLLVKLVFLHQVLAQGNNGLERDKQELGNNSTLLQRDWMPKDTVDSRQPSSANKGQSGASELENILWRAVDNNEWPLALYLMNEFTANTKNGTVHYIAYKVLWRKLKANKLHYDPKNIIDLYLAMKNVTLSQHDICRSEQFSSLGLEIRAYLIERSAQLFEVPLHPVNYNATNSICNNETSYPVVRQVLSQLERLDEDIFDEILNVAFDAVELLESNRSVAAALNCLGLNANQRLVTHLAFLNRNKDFHSLLYNDVQQLLTECDMGKLPPKYLEQISIFLPASMVALQNASAVCIRNTTGNFAYLSECAQTTLMCTYSSAYKYRSVFEVERLLGNKYTFHSTFWKRFIKLETNYPNGNGSVPAFIKNVYSSAPPSVWQVLFVGNNVALVDPNMRQYLCGGNQTMWSQSEQHAYTRRAEDFQLYQNECLWLIEDCSYLI